MTWKYNPARYTAAMGHLVERAGGEIDADVLCALLFLADRAALLLTGEPITTVSDPGDPSLAVTEADMALLDFVFARYARKTPSFLDAYVRSLPEYRDGTVPKSHFVKVPLFDSPLAPPGITE